MRSEHDKMLAGDLYLAADPSLTAARARCRRALRELDALDDPAARFPLLAALLGGIGPDSVIEPPFRCDYGSNIFLGARFYANSGVIILDVNRIRFGDDVLLGPNVQIYSATHPIDAELRLSGLELGLPITIGDNVWIGGGAILLPGVIVGSGTTIGAGSVVTRAVPANVLAAGNPCTVLRELSPRESR